MTLPGHGFSQEFPMSHAANGLCDLALRVHIERLVAESCRKDLRAGAINVNKKKTLTRVLMYDQRETVLDFTSYRETDVKVMNRKLTSCDSQ